jgi:hypothetical protein
MRTCTVVGFRLLAVVAEQLQRFFWIALSFEPGREAASSPYLTPVLGAVIVEVIQRKELWFALATADTAATVGLDHLLALALVVLLCALNVMLITALGRRPLASARAFLFVTPAARARLSKTAFSMGIAQKVAYRFFSVTAFFTGQLHGCTLAQSATVEVF